MIQTKNMKSKIKNTLNKLFLLSIFIILLSSNTVFSLDYKEFNSLYKLIQTNGSNKNIPQITEEQFKKVMKNESVVSTGNTGTDDKFAFLVKRAHVPMWKLWAVIIDREHYRVFNKEIKESKILEKSNEYFLTYLFIDSSFGVKDRHQVLECHANQKLYEASKKRIWEHYFKIHPNQTEQIREAMNNGILKLSKDTILNAEEITKNNGEWILIDLDKK